MAIVRLQHIGLAVTDLKTACEQFERVLGLKARDYRNDQGRGMQLDARILVGNGCWLHLVQNWNPESRVYQFHDKFGSGLEHIAVETDSIEQDVQHLRDLGVPIYMDKIFNAPDGFEAFIYPDQTLAMTVELIQPHTTSWAYPTDGGSVSSKLGITRLQHAGVAVRDVEAVRQRFQELFGLSSTDDAGNTLQARLPFPNDCWLQLLSDTASPRVADFMSKQGTGLEHIAFLTDSLVSDLNTLHADKIAIDAPVQGGTAAWLDRADVAGTTIELVSSK